MALFGPGVTEVTEDTSLIWLQDDDSDESEQPAHQSCKQSGEDRKDPDYQAPSRFLYAETFVGGASSIHTAVCSAPLPSERLFRSVTEFSSPSEHRPRRGDLADLGSATPRPTWISASASSTLRPMFCPGKVRFLRVLASQFPIVVMATPSRHCTALAVFQKCPVQELQCPRGLQEADFLHLLRATFPQLTADRPFDVFTTDRTKRLKPLTLAALTPEEIDRSLRAVGHSALYIRLQVATRSLASWCECRR